MSFTNSPLNKDKMVDNVFKITKLAKAAKAEGKDVIDATIGTLRNEDGSLAVNKIVYENLEKISDTDKASYASQIIGNQDYLDAVKDWVLQDKCQNMYCALNATAGGTGAITSVIFSTLKAGETFLYPDTGWGNYKIIADTLGLNKQNYEMFKDDSFNTESLRNNAEDILIKQGHLTLIINDPCQNPTGYSLSYKEWEETVNILNELSSLGTIVLINDIAYIDYSRDLEHSRDYLDCFKKLNENVLVAVAFSCSKTMSAYGQRTGADIILSNNKAATEELGNALERYSRSTWSNINNAFMINFAEVMNNHKDEFLKENRQMTEMLNKRAELFIKQAEDCSLPVYPYKDGFFVTVKVDNETRDQYHEALLNKDIYTIKVNKGIRVALCSLSLDKCNNLAYKLKEILDNIKR